MKFTTVILTIAITALAFGCSKKEPAPTPTPETPPAVTPQETETPTPIPADTPEPAQEQTGQKAAALEGLTFVKGSPVTLTEGQVYVVEFWATWCPPCKESIPHLTKIQKQFKDKGVTVIGVSNEDINTVKPFVEKQGETMNYTVAVDTAGKVDAGYMRAFGQNGIPTAFIVDAKGNVAWVGHPMDGLDEVLAQVVEGAFDAQAYAKAKAEREAAERQLYEMYQQYFTAVQNGSTIEQTRPIAEKFIEAGHTEALNAMAWNILEQDGPGADTEIALKAAEKANTQTNSENPMVLDTYALALFKNNKVAEAVAAQEKAIALAGDNEGLQADLKARLEEYKAALQTPQSSKESN
jgi:thiol-disulfide isomerase/thioredoxin